MCWHKDIAKFQILMKTVLNQCLGIQYECRVAKGGFMSESNGRSSNCPKNVPKTIGNYYNLLLLSDLKPPLVLHPYFGSVVLFEWESNV